MTSPTPDEEALADEIVTQATAHLGGSVPPQVLQAIRTNLLDELRLTTEGRRRVRALARDRATDQSGTVARNGSAPGKAGTGT